jgi:hypothetical protein
MDIYAQPEDIHHAQNHQKSDDQAWRFFQHGNTNQLRLIAQTSAGQIHKKQKMLHFQTQARFF